MQKSILLAAIQKEILYMRGMAAELGIVKGKPFAPDASARALLDKAARTSFRMGHIEGYTPSPLVKDGLFWPDRAVWPKQRVHRA